MPDEGLIAEAWEVDDMRRRALFGVAGGAALSGTAGALESVRRQLDATLTGRVTDDDAVEWERVADQYSRLGDDFLPSRCFPAW
jgi:hypothetical protein